MAATPRQPNPCNKEQKDTKNMRDTKGIDLGGDGSILPESPVQEQNDPKGRDFRITPDILLKFGYTKGCAGFEAKIFGTRHQGHTGACRARLEEKMATDEIMKETIRRRNQRIVDYKIPTEATTERVDQASAEQEKQPEMPEDLPVDSEDDIPDSDTDNTSDNMGVDEPPEAGSMRERRKPTRSMRRAKLQWDGKESSQLDLRTTRPRSGSAYSFSKTLRSPSRT